MANSRIKSNFLTESHFGSLATHYFYKLSSLKIGATCCWVFSPRSVNMSWCFFPILSQLEISVKTFMHGWMRSQTETSLWKGSHQNWLGYKTCFAFEIPGTLMKRVLPYRKLIWKFKSLQKRFKLIRTTDKVFHDVIPKQTHFLLFVLLYSKLRT